MPPAPIRRPLTITVWTALSLLCVILSPVLVGVGALAARIMGRPQPRLLAHLLLAYCLRELGVIAAAAGLWLISGCGAAIHTPPIKLAHHRLLRWFVRGLADRVLTLLDIDVAADVSEDVATALAADRPLLFFSRHAGPGDTLLLIDLLIRRYGRSPSIVFKETLLVDPAIDLIGHRLPHAVLDTADAAQCEARIAEVTAGLAARGVLVLFPEGGNFTVQRRRRALRSLRSRGRTHEARVAEQMTHMMPPHPGGALAALNGNPEADVIFSAHTGLGLAAFPRQLWREVPMSQTLKARLWLAPAAERPSAPEAQVSWLYGWWKRLDEWVEHEGEEPAEQRADG